MKNRPFKPRRRIEKDIGLQAHTLNGAGNELTAHPYVIPRAGQDGKLDVSFIPAGAVAAHAPTHSSGGTDPVTITNLAGFPGGAVNFLRADATFAAPGGGSGITVIQKDDIDVVNPAATIDFLGNDFNVTASPATEGNIAINRNAVNGISGLDAGGLIGTAQLPTVPIANGGTGQTAKTAAFDALSPVTTRGDVIVRDATNNVRLGVGAANRLFRSNGTDPSWAQADLTTDVTGALPIGNGGTGQITQTAAFNALDPLTTKGDIIVHDGTNSVRQAVGATDGDVLTVKAASSTGLSYLTPATSFPYDPGNLTIADLNYKVMANHLVLSGTERLTLQGNSRLTIV